jgi:hypothetical protein
MIGEMEIVRQAFEKTAEMPEGKPRWGTPPITDLPGEAHPEGVDENKPVGNDAQNKGVLVSNFSSAPAVEADLRGVLSGALESFTAPTRVSHSQLIKDFSPTPRSLRVMAGVLRSRLQA